MVNISKDKVHKLLIWFQEVLNLETLFTQIKNIRKVYRGEIYFCNLGEGIGTELCKNRPCIIVQNNILGNTATKTIVVPITRGGKAHEKAIVIPPITYNDRFGTTQTLTGTVVTADIRTLNKIRLGSKIGKIDSSTMARIEEDLIFFLGMKRRIDIYESNLKSKEKKITADKEIIKKLKEELELMKQQNQSIKLKK